MTHTQFRIAIFVAGVTALSLLAACASSAAPLTTVDPKPTSLVMGYIPDVQFAPLFLAEERGYFAEEGIALRYNWGFEFDGIKLVGADQSDFALASGDQVLQARAQGIPIVYVGNYYNAFPISVVSLAEKNITEPSHLRGKQVGLPGLFGASYTAWRALLYAAAIDPQQVHVETIGFTQVQALDQGTVDAAVVYANNEPVQLSLAGKKVNQIRTWEYARLVGNGIIASEKTLKERPELVRGFMRALTRGIQETIKDPEAALVIVTKRVPEAGGANLEKSRAVLQATLPLWQNNRIGQTHLEDWQAMAKFMLDAGLIQEPLDVSRAFSNEFVP